MQSFIYIHLLDLIWLIFLGGLLSYFLKQFVFLRQARGWLIVKGHISSVKWTTHEPRLWPEIEYTYQIFEQEFTGHYFFLDTRFNSPYSRYARQIAYKAVLAFNSNQDIDVYYNPQNPAQAALDVQIPNKLKLLIVILSTLIVIGIINLVV